MDADGLLEQLEYSGAAGFLDESRWDQAIEHAHVFRHTAEACQSPKVQGRFRGIYMLGLSSNEGCGALEGQSIPMQLRATTPVVYVAEAKDARSADAIHHLVWNQAIVPFLIVYTPKGVRLYSGFDYEPASSTSSRSATKAAASKRQTAAAKVPPSQKGVLEATIAFKQVADRLSAFRARNIDNGDLWRTWGDRVDPSRRVDVRLLGHLKKLGEALREEGELRPYVAHALIGRFVYLRYLRERGVLSDNLLRSWEMDSKEIFGRTLRLESFHQLLANVDERLNGSIFPLPVSGKGAPTEKHVRKVATVMLGDNPDSGQMHLDFRAYDFSHIPIEMLSAIYEQFMAAEGRDKEAGAFYTPLPLVNFVLSELDDLRLLKEGMKVLDPACGSGAFLVQCYQLLVEKKRGEVKRDLSAKELRELLTSHIFGMDRDEDACRVTEFSLALALLDQIPSETLTRLHNFKLPNLHENNIRHCDFFETDAPERTQGFDWIVGNPPWITAGSGTAAHKPALTWMKQHLKTHPVSGQQIAEAFAWRAPEFLREDGIIALVLPATTFFKEQTSFREAFFKCFDVKAVVNLTNLREVLFEGRARLPAFVTMYGSGTAGAKAEEDIAVYSPLVVNQEAIRPLREGERQAAWTITVDHAEVRFVPRREVEDGNALRWKVSMWGGPRDLKLLRSVAQRFPSLEVAAKGRWKMAEGLQLRDHQEKEKKAEKEQETLVPLPEVKGKRELLVSPLRDAVHVHSFPVRALREVPASRAYARKRGGTAAFPVSEPPHIIVHEARTFAVFIDEFLLVPPRQIGIAGAPAEENVLRALALYLGSDFTWYHQFFMSSHMEFRGVSTLNALKTLPVPLLQLDSAQVRTWADLQKQLAALSDKRWVLQTPKSESLFTHGPTLLEQTATDIEAQMDVLEREVNDLTSAALGLRPKDKWLIQDLVHVRRHLADGKIGTLAAGPPTVPQLNEYALALRDELDTFLDRGRRFQHALTIVHEARAGMVQITFSPANKPHIPSVEEAASPVGQKLRAMRDRIDREHGQWLYFDRNLAMYMDGKVFLSKPMQRLWWTRSQALSDADRIIADLIAAGTGP